MMELGGRAERLGYSAAEIQIGALVAGELIVPERGGGGVSLQPTVLEKTHRVPTPNVRVLGLRVSLGG